MTDNPTYNPLLPLSLATAVVRFRDDQCNLTAAQLLHEGLSLWRDADLPDDVFNRLVVQPVVTHLYAEAHTDEARDEAEEALQRVAVDEPRLWMDGVARTMTVADFEAAGVAPQVLRDAVRRHEQLQKVDQPVNSDNTERDVMAAAEEALHSQAFMDAALRHYKGMDQHPGDEEVLSRAGVLTPTGKP